MRPIPLMRHAATQDLKIQVLLHLTTCFLG